jgi:hypothetical protein
MGCCMSRVKDKSRHHSEEEPEDTQAQEENSFKIPMVRNNIPKLSEKLQLHTESKPVSIIKKKKIFEKIEEKISMGYKTGESLISERISNYAEGEGENDGAPQN